MLQNYLTEELLIHPLLYLQVLSGNLSKMQFSNLLIISSAVLSLTLPGVAFVPHQQVKDLQGSFDVAIQRAVESANITPKKSSAVVTEPKTTSKDNKAASKSEMASTIPAHTVKHKKWGVDNQNEEEYWYDSRIHTLGNQGIMGAVRRYVLRACVLLRIIFTGN